VFKSFGKYEMDFSDSNLERGSQGEWKSNKSLLFIKGFAKMYYFDGQPSFVLAAVMEDSWRG
jgi:hypothetical protein